MDFPGWFILFEIQWCVQGESQECPRCPRKNNRLLKASHSWVILRGRQTGSRPRCCKTDDINFIMFCIKKLLFGRRFANFLVSFNIKDGISLILCDGLANVLLETFKSLKLIFCTLVNGEQWLSGSQEISTIKSSRMKEILQLRKRSHWHFLKWHLQVNTYKNTSSALLLFSVSALLPISACTVFD